MINRELIRTKIVQLTYAFFQNGSSTIDTAERELLFSLDKAYDLYHYMLAIIPAITEVARQRYEVSRARAERGEGEMPSDRFLNNRFAMQLAENHQLREWQETQKQTWNDNIEVTRRLLDQIEQSEAYQAYMASETEPEYADDRELWRKLYKQFVENNADIDQMLEEKSLYWNDDKEIVDTFVLKTIKRFAPENEAQQELLPEYNDPDDRDFAVRLFRASILNSDQYQQYMRQSSRNWDFSRMAYMDIILIQIAIAEMLSFPAIPVAVTINEYVDLAKLYSTPKSWKYINGMLDTISHYLSETGKMLKPVREEKK